MSNRIAATCGGRQAAGFGGSGDRRSAECAGGSIVSSVFMVSLRSDNHLLKELTFDCVARNSRTPTARVDLDTPGKYTNPFIQSFGRVPGYPGTTRSCGRQHVVGLQDALGANRRSRPDLRLTNPRDAGERKSWSCAFARIGTVVDKAPLSPIIHDPDHDFS